VPRSTLEPIIAGLMADGLLSKGGEHRLIPGRDPHRITLAEIVAAVRGEVHEKRAPDAWSQAIDAIADRIESAIASELGPRTVGELVDENLEKQSS
jgi:DNA-binding IscR family transcriptional regulator